MYKTTATTTTTTTTTTKTRQLQKYKQYTLISESNNNKVPWLEMLPSEGWRVFQAGTPLNKWIFLKSLFWAEVSAVCHVLLSSYNQKRHWSWSVPEFCLSCNCYGKCKCICIAIYWHIAIYQHIRAGQSEEFMKEVITVITTIYHST